MHAPKTTFGIEFLEDCGSSKLVGYLIQGRGIVMLPDDALFK